MYTAIKLQINAQISFLVVLNCLLFFFVSVIDRSAPRKVFILDMVVLRVVVCFWCVRFVFYIVLGHHSKTKLFKLFFCLYFFYSSIKVKSINSDK